MTDLPLEEVRALFVDKRHRLIGEVVISDQRSDGCRLDTQALVTQAKRLGARGLILAHNHPSGGAVPSQADVDATRAVIALCEVFDLSLHDHIVIAREGWTSMRGGGLL